jgi:hypothetical protein|tara:strand:+ start:1312 stop:1560 length:249 start_codon:yes stop_codon:yes gene_type:complete
MSLLNWNPKIGDLVVYRQGRLIGSILNVEKSAYGYWVFEVLVDDKVQLLSSLNCDPIEHCIDLRYDYSNLSGRRKNDNYRAN